MELRPTYRYPSRADVTSAVISLVVVTLAAAGLAALPHVLLVPRGIVVVDPQDLAIAALAIAYTFGSVIQPWLFPRRRPVRTR